MLETVAKGFKTARNYLQGQAELTESNTDQALREVRHYLTMSEYTQTK